MASPIFREKSLERLSSPEQLDRVMQVTRPLGWVSLLGCFCLIAVALTWGIKGRIHTVTRGQGILLREGAIYDVVSLGTGQVKSIRVRVEDHVEKGQVIADLFLPDLDHNIQEEKDRLASLESERAMIHTLGENTARIKRTTMKKQRQALERAIADERENLVFLRTELAHQKEFQAKGLTTSQKVQQAKNRVEQALQRIMKAQSQLNDISAKEADLTAGVQKERFALDHRISQARLRIKSLEETRALESRVVSSRSGRVLEVYKNSGKVIRTGEPVISIEVENGASDSLSAFLYFSPEEGKKIQKEMTVRISPSTVRMEESGYLIGRIRQVSGFPASRKGMQRILQNPDLVDSLSEGGAPIAVTAELLPDPDSPSLYRWSSGKGPDIRIESGTLCAARVVVKSQAPIRLVVPYVKKHLLGIGEGQLGHGRD